MTGSDVDVTTEATEAAEATEATATKDAGDWYAALPEDIRGHASMRKFTSGEALAKSYINLEKTLGSEKVALPKGADDTEGWERLYKAAGRPDVAEGYEFRKFEELPEGFDYPKETEDAFREIAHKAGLSVRQAQTLRDWFVENAAAAYADEATEDDTASDLALAELQREWGNATGQKLALAQHAVEQHFGAEFKEMLDETGLGNDVRLIRGLAKLAEITGADRDLAGRGATQATPGELKDQIARFRAEHAGSLMDKMHPEHNRHVQQLHDLYVKLHPEQAA